MRAFLIKSRAEILEVLLVNLEVCSDYSYWSRRFRDSEDTA
jgi:hypothetical protein